MRQLLSSASKHPELQDGFGVEWGRGGGEGEPCPLDAGKGAYARGPGETSGTPLKMC